jgi:hypothetical protein
MTRGTAGVLVIQPDAVGPTALAGCFVDALLTVAIVSDFFPGAGSSEAV